MVNIEILGGLQAALKRGESLEKAMFSFYNAGYKKEEIEDAARFIQQGNAPTPAVKEIAQPVFAPSRPKVSSYDQKETGSVKKAAKGLIIAIIIAAIIFVGLLIAFLLTTR